MSAPRFVSASPHAAHRLGIPHDVPYILGRYLRFMHMEQRQTPGRDHRCATIVSQESPGRLERLRQALEGAGIETIVQSASSPARVSVGYIRSIDPQLSGGSEFVQVSALGAKPAFMVNTPGSVRIAEWSPLATHALRDRGVPQPRRMWCLDHDDLVRASEMLGTPITFEGVVTRLRTVASASNELERAFAEAVGPHAHRGAMAEAHLPEQAAHLSIMVIDGACIPLRPAPRRAVSPLATLRATQVAGDAVAALGGSAMAVDVMIDGSGDAYVTRVDAAPHMGRLNDVAVAALANAIATRLASAWPPLRVRRRAARARLAPLAQVGHPC